MMDKKYFLGIDGGGTKTKVYVIDQDKNEIYIGHGGPSAIDSVPAKTTLESINKALENLPNDIKFTACFIGLGGIKDANDEQNLIEMSASFKGVTSNTKVWAKNDTYNALATSLNFDEGIVIIAGTGMNCLGIDKKGKTHTAGGLGYFEGDLGSAYSLGFLSMKSVARALDGRIPLTKYHEFLIEKTGVNSPGKVIEYFHDFVNSRTKIASLAKITTDFAEMGDIYANEIVDLAANELLLCLKAVDKNINLDKKVLTIIGGLGTNPSSFTRKLHKLIHEYDKNIIIQGPKVDPALAAALLAEHKFNNK